MEVREIVACRACGSARLEPVLELGNLCLSGFLLPGQAEAPRAPLELLFCRDCTLVQLRHTVERDALYREYWYRSGTNESMVAALRDVVNDAQRWVKLKADDYVLDVGCNDGTMLAMFPDYCVRCGFEPSNIGREAMEKHEGNLYIVPDYWPERGVPTRKGFIKVLTSIAMFYDLDDPNAFVAEVKEQLHENGVWVVQFQDLGSMLRCNGFDNVCHEHVTYWSEYAFASLLGRHGLQIVDQSYNLTNGGSVRYIVTHGQQQTTYRGLEQAVNYAFDLGRFGAQVERRRDETVAMLRGLAIRGNSVYGYGASTKGNTLLQYYRIGPDLLPAIAERNPEKVGLVTAGTNIPIISEANMREDRPDFLFILPWHFRLNFIERESEYLRSGGKMIFPLPELSTVGGESCQLSTDKRFANISARSG